MAAPANQCIADLFPLPQRPAALSHAVTSHATADAAASAGEAQWRADLAAVGQLACLEDLSWSYTPSKQQAVDPVGALFQAGWTNLQRLTTLTIESPGHKHMSWMGENEEQLLQLARALPSLRRLPLRGVLWDAELAQLEADMPKLVITRPGYNS